MKIMTEETFGPVLPIMKVRDAEEGLRMANDSRYGLNSSIFTKDIKKGESIANRISAGNATVNDVNVNYSAQELPFGGWNESGIGVRHGPQGIRKYCKSRSVLVTRFAPKRDVHYFPYKPRVTKLEDRFSVWLHTRRPKRRA
jgi:acyl-CoA reductase-like NAD-dependent aldehyde dehydrogenase